MGPFITGRLLSAIPVLLGVTLLVFGLMKLMPGDPVLALLGDHVAGLSEAELHAIRDKYGFNDPWYVQYWSFLRDFTTGHLRSILTEESVMGTILKRFPYTLLLTTVSLTLATLIALPLGILSALKRNTIWDRLVMGLTLLGLSIPGFWFAVIIMLLFSLKLGWLPASGSGTPAHLVMPVMTVTFTVVALLTRMMRSSLLETLPQDYVRTAQAKGLQPRQVFRHAFRNSLAPIVTLLGLEFGALLAGAAITESIFAWPGMGRLTLEAVQNHDIYMVQGVVVFVAAIFLLVNLLVDVLYAVLNPRVQYA